MGQINTTPDSGNTENDGTQDGKTQEETNAENAQRKENTLEQVRCVKTRIDMLIEDCLNTKEVPDESGNDKKEAAHPNNDREKAKCDTVSDNGNGNTDCNDKSEGINKSDCKKAIDRKESCESVQNDGCDNNSDCCDKVETESLKKGSKQELKVSDIITNMVSTEITQTQLKQIQQRTITTFNTFIDKVLDNSLTKEMNEESNGKSSNILELYTNSMPAGDKRPDNNVSKHARRESSSNEGHQNKPERTITLKDHIEKFLELSFRDETEDEKKHQEKKSNSTENFNAQGLVNSMITQGLQINRLLTTKEQQGSQPERLHQQKEFDAQVRQAKLSEQTLKPHSRDSHRKGSPNMKGYPERNENRNGRMMVGHPMADTKYNNKQEVGQRNALLPHGYGRRDEGLERNVEARAKMSPNMKQEMNAGRNSKLASAFHHPQHQVTSNNAYYHPAYGARMQLSPGQVRDIKSPINRDGKHIVHMRDCTCPICVSQTHHARHGLVDPSALDHRAGKLSPNIPQQLLAHNLAVQAAAGGHLREVPAMMRPSHSEIPPGLVAYPGMHKLLPHHPPITSPKVYPGGQLVVPSEMSPQTMMATQRPGLHEHQQHSQYYHQRRSEDFPHSPASHDRPASHSGKRSPYLVRPSSVPSQDHSAMMYSRSNPGYRYEPEHMKNTESVSGSSDCSGDAPLDLTVKKPKMDSLRNRASSNASAIRKINPPSPFIKHIENSVDKYWQELNSPPSSPSYLQSATPVNRSLTPNDARSSAQPYPRQSPNRSSPPGLVPNRPLPSPHFAGGITVGQPLIDMKNHSAQKSSEYQYDNSRQTGLQVASQQPQQHNQYSGNQSGFERNSNRVVNNVSKHEPIQNIIGQHDPNDILYLFCRLCNQTYGSPYGFRKHFRNQHGFEPRAEHALVQTISATKTALHQPQPQLVHGVPEIRESHFVRRSSSPEVDNCSNHSRQNLNVPAGMLEQKSMPASPTDSKSLTGSEDSEKIELDNSETKFLECPECGKTFQLNDFGSYKRHCRQHNNVRMNGPLTCSDCHLPFPDQKSLREHYVVHVKEAPVPVKQEQKIEGVNVKPESHQTCYACVKCEKQFDNVSTYTQHLSSHDLESKVGDGLEDSVKSEQTAISIKSEDENPVDIITSNNVVKQAAESNTSFACPDSSWDNVVKGVASSNKIEANADLSESDGGNSVKDEGSVDGKMDVKDEKSSSKDSKSESDSESKSEDNEFLYKHKKFAHHRKRALSFHSQSSEATEAKQMKTCSESPGPQENTPSSSLCTTPVQDSVTCDSTASKEPKVLETVTTKEISSVKPIEKTLEKPVKTEARHSLPFVWDRTTRSQKKS